VLPSCAGRADIVICAAVAALPIWCPADWKIKSERGPLTVIDVGNQPPGTRQKRGEWQDLSVVNYDYLIAASEMAGGLLRHVSKVGA